MANNAQIFCCLVEAEKNYSFCTWKFGLVMIIDLIFQFQLLLFCLLEYLPYAVAYVPYEVNNKKLENMTW